AQHVEGAVAGPVLRDLRGRQPGAVGVREEVVLGADRGVHVGAVDAVVHTCPRRRGVVGCGQRYVVHLASSYDGCVLLAEELLLLTLDDETGRWLVPAEAVRSAVHVALVTDLMACRGL